MGNNKQVMVTKDDGSYFWDDPFFQPCGPIERWVVVSFDGSHDAVIKTLCHKLSEQARKRGMHIGNPLGVECWERSRGSPDGWLRGLGEHYQGLQLVVAIISENKDHNGKEFKPPLDRWSVLNRTGAPVICIQWSASIG